MKPSNDIIHTRVQTGGAGVGGEGVEEEGGGLLVLVFRQIRRKTFNKVGFDGGFRNNIGFLRCLGVNLWVRLLWWENMWSK